MSNEWYKVDNVAKVFLANHSARNPQTLRVSCTLKEDVDPETLQEALDTSIELFPELSVRIRRGFFWHYIESTDVRAIVKEESGSPCPILYGAGFDGFLHFKVTYYGKRINVDIFHALADGTGALAFLKVLVLNYLKLKHPDALQNVSLASDSSETERTQNSFEHFYENSNGAIPKQILNKKKKAYSIQSRLLPYNQLRFIELHMEGKEIVAKAKEMHVSVTSYLGALLMFAIREGMPFMMKHKPINVSMPVNLRNFYPSETTRNFFNNVDVSHAFDGSETIESLASEFDAKLKESLKPESITAQMNRYQSMERLFFTRMVPLFIKQPIVKFFAKSEKKTVSCVLSNLGVIKLPPEMAEYISEISDFCSTDGFFVTVTSFGTDMVLGISTANAETGTVRRLIKHLNETGVNIKAYVSEVIE